METRVYEFGFRVVDPGLLDKEGYAPFRETKAAEVPYASVEDVTAVAPIFLYAPHHYAQIMWRWKGDLDWRPLWRTNDPALIRNR